MGRLASLFLEPGAQAWLGGRFRAARARGMGVCTAFLATLLLALAYLLLRLEGPAWRRLRERYGPAFAHLTQRRHLFADPLRYALQTVWVMLVRPRSEAVREEPLRARPGRARGIRTAVRSAVHAGLGRRTEVALAASARLLRTCAQHTGRLGFALLTVLALLLGALLITQPFNLYAQAIFVVLLWGVATGVRRIPGRFATLVLIVLSLTVSARYVWWRYTATLNWNDGLDLFFGLLLLAAETYSWVVLVLGYIQTAWPLRRLAAPLPKDRSQWPVVDLMIPTYNEDLSVVKPTVYAALGMDWPKDKLRIYLLDDGRRDAFREFAEQVGINYIVRPDGRHAKAGNLNHALGQTSGELIAIFDCDHIPTRSFLQLTTGWFFKDEKLALVQTPHHFFSPDPFERNLGEHGERPNENILFYGLVQAGNDLWNAAFFCGSCAVLKRAALEDIGGFAVETVTEDAHTALRLHRHGYTSAYLNIPMAAGLATESLSAHIGQRIRWARGMVQIFRTDNPLLGKGLSLFQRLCYANAMLHFLSGIPRLIYLLAPLAFLLLHSYIIYAPGIAIALYVLPYMAHATVTNSRMQGPYRRSFASEIYETVLAWYTARPTLVALFLPKKGRFNVTEKGGLVDRDYFDWTIAVPYLVLAAANLLGLGFGVWRLWTGPLDEVVTVLITMAWVIYNLIVLGGAIAVAAEARQMRSTHRVRSSLPCGVRLASGHVYAGGLTNYSEGGVGLATQAAVPVQAGQQVQIILSRGQRQNAFPGTVVRRAGNELGVRFSALSRQQHIDLVQCTFARADSWLTSHRSFSYDRPVRSFRDAVLHGLTGYRKLAEYVVFPFNVSLRKSVGLVSWLFSFVPRTPRIPS